MIVNLNITGCNNNTKISLCLIPRKSKYENLFTKENQIGYPNIYLENMKTYKP
jgi:hypothetical protein